MTSAWVWIGADGAPATDEDFRKGDVRLVRNEPPNRFGQHEDVVGFSATHAEDMSVDVTPSDAALIAAAPEMAEALEVAHRALLHAGARIAASVVEAALIQAGTLKRTPLLPK